MLSCVCRVVSCRNEGLPLYQLDLLYSLYFTVQTSSHCLLFSSRLKDCLGNSPSWFCIISPIHSVRYHFQKSVSPPPITVIFSHSLSHTSIPHSISLYNFPKVLFPSNFVLSSSPFIYNASFLCLCLSFFIPFNIVSVRCPFRGAALALCSSFGPNFSLYVAPSVDLYRFSQISFPGRLFYLSFCSLILAIHQAACVSFLHLQMRASSRTVLQSGFSAR